MVSQRIFYGSGLPLVSIFLVMILQTCAQGAAIPQADNTACYYIDTSNKVYFDLNPVSTS